MKAVVFIAALALAGTASAQSVETCSTYSTNSRQSIKPIAKNYLRSRVTFQLLRGQDRARAMNCFSQYVSEVREAVAHQCLLGELNTDALREELLSVAGRCEALSVQPHGPVVPEPAEENEG